MILCLTTPKLMERKIMDNRNVFVAIALSMSVLLFWGAFFETQKKILMLIGSRHFYKSTEMHFRESIPPDMHDYVDQKLRPQKSS